MNIAHLGTTSDTLDTVAKFFRVMEKAGVSFEQLLLPINNLTARQNLVGFLKAGCPKLNGVIKLSKICAIGYGIAPEILGEDFISPEEVMAVRPNVIYSASDLEALRDAMPSRQELELLKNEDVVLLPKPARAQALSLLGIRELRPDYFYSTQGGWFSAEKQHFAHEEQVARGWLKLRKGLVPSSLGKEFAQQKKLISDSEYIPDAAHFAWAVTTYKVVRDVDLFSGKNYVRTSSRGSGGNPVSICNSSRGLNLSDLWGDGTYPHLGLVSAYK